MALQERWPSETGEVDDPIEYRQQGLVLLLAAYNAATDLFQIKIDAASQTATRQFRPAPPDSQSWAAYRRLIRFINARLQD